MKELVLQREKADPVVRGTKGHFVGIDIYTLELPWLDNKKGVSCIPTGTYPMEWTWSPRHKKEYWRIYVPGRRGILIHRGNYLRDTSGCVLVGKRIFANSKTSEYEIAGGTSMLAYFALLNYLKKEPKWNLRVENDF